MRLRSFLAGFVPNSVIVRKHAMAAWRNGEPELKMIPVLCETTKTAIDVGANYGVYTFFMARHCWRVVAIEPNPRYARLLKNAINGNVEVIEGAASDRSGETTIRIPAAVEKIGMATIEPQNSLENVAATALRVRLLTLDSLDVSDVNLIKVDVEGHELAVLRGALQIISRDRPAILVEAEERHRPNAIGSTRDLLGPYGYRGFFLLGGRYVGIDTFDPSRYQDIRALAPSGDAAGKPPYVNNFLFLSRDIEATLKRLAAAAG